MTSPIVGFCMFSCVPIFSVVGRSSPTSSVVVLVEVVLGDCNLEVWRDGLASLT